MNRRNTRTTNAEDADASGAEDAAQLVVDSNDRPPSPQRVQRSLFRRHQRSWFRFFPPAIAANWPQDFCPPT